MREKGGNGRSFSLTGVVSQDVKPSKPPIHAPNALPKSVALLRILRSIWRQLMWANIFLFWDIRRNIGTSYTKHRRSRRRRVYTQRSKKA